MCSWRAYGASRGLGRPQHTGETYVESPLLTAAQTLLVDFVPVQYVYQALAREVRQAELPEECIETMRTG